MLENIDKLVNPCLDAGNFLQAKAQLFTFVSSISNHQVKHCLAPYSVHGSASENIWIFGHEFLAANFVRRRFGDFKELLVVSLDRV